MTRTPPYTPEIIWATLDAVRARRIAEAYRIVEEADHARGLWTRTLGNPLECPIFGARNELGVISLALDIWPVIIGDLPLREKTLVRTAAITKFLGIEPRECGMADSTAISSRLAFNVTWRMLIFAVQNKRSLDQYIRTGMNGPITVLLASRDPFSPCQECEKLRNFSWSLGAQPEIPYPHCTHEMGCRCCLSFGYTDKPS